MEIFTDDRHFIQPAAGSFPPSADFTAHLQPPDDQFITDHRFNLPPQKLRPIRGHGRSPAEYTPEFADVVEFLGYQKCPVNSGECFQAGIKADVGCSGPVRTGQGAEPADRFAGVESRASEELTGSLSSGDNSSVDTNETPSRKRKWRSRRKIEVLMENLIFKVMERQEQMHKQLMEMIESNETERIRREEAWKRQQMERVKKEEESRAQEASRSVAIISFIQKILGHDIEIPLPSSGSCMEENGGRDGNDDQRQQENNTPSNPEGEKHPGASDHPSIDQDDVNPVGCFNSSGKLNCLKLCIDKVTDPQGNINALRNEETEDLNRVKCLDSDNHLQMISVHKNGSTDRRWMGAQSQTNISRCAKSHPDGFLNHLMGNDALKDGNQIQKFINRQYDPNTRRWPEPEVQALITLRSELEPKFRSMGSKCSVWEEISTGMSKLGYSRSAKKCKEKWENMNKYFKKAMESGKKKPYENSKRCTYFHDLDMLYKNGVSEAENPTNGLSNLQDSDTRSTPT